MKHFLKIDKFDLYATLECGQCFRWRRVSDGVFSGIVGNSVVCVEQTADGILLHGVSESDLPYWERYFAVDVDYDELIHRFSDDATLKSACGFSPGIRVLRQEPFETLITFIISQNNNIPRIAGIVEKLCLLFDGAFPAPADLANLSETDLAVLRAGYRASYILDAAKKVNSCEISLDKVAKMPYNIAKVELCKIKGVGNKVADCVLLFGFAMWEAFPRDVWVNRVMDEYYPQGLPKCTQGFEGIAQQFLFHYIRNKNRS
jgi:N-glycosylase/DNA lyase